MNNTMETDKIAHEMRTHFSGRNVYLLWSGGYDSNLLLQIILNSDLFQDNDITIVTIPTPQHAYDLSKLRAVRDMLESMGMRFAMLEPVEQMDDSIASSEACLLCKRIRRESLKQYYLPRKQINDMIVTGHNLSDLMAYFAELCIQQLQNRPFIDTRERYLEVANKFFTIYKTEIETLIYRPILEYSQEEIHQYLESFAGRYDIDILGQACIWKDQRKRVLQEYFFKSSIVSSFTKTYGSFDKIFGIPAEKEFRELPFDTYLV